MMDKGELVLSVVVVCRMGRQSAETGGVPVDGAPGGQCLVQTPGATRGCLEVYPHGSGGGPKELGERRGTPDADRQTRWCHCYSFSRRLRTTRAQLSLRVTARLKTSRSGLLSLASLT